MSFLLTGTQSHTQAHTRTSTNTHTQLDPKHVKGRAAARGQLPEASPPGASLRASAVLKPNEGWEYLSGRSTGPLEVLPTFGYQHFKSGTIVSCRYRACYNPWVIGM